MASRKTAPLDGGLLVRKGEAAPATEGSPRRDPIAVTVKLSPDLYVALKSYAARRQPISTNQAILVKALETFLRAEGAL
jgi:hypothetical protein